MGVSFIRPFVRFATNQRGDNRPNLVRAIGTCPAPRLRSSRVMISKETVRRAIRRPLGFGGSDLAPAPA